MRRKVEQPGDQNVRHRGAECPHRVQTRASHQHQRQPRSSQPRSGRGFICSFAGEPSPRRLRRTQEVVRGQGALDQLAIRDEEE